MIFGISSLIWDNNGAAMGLDSRKCQGHQKRFLMVKSKPLAHRAHPKKLLFITVISQIHATYARKMCMDLSGCTLGSQAHRFFDCELNSAV